ncbi:ChaN family lipoprotein [Sandaracinobacteroides hominis]|uniref:ChaN family lipoprotein n=1 Tax=Sandaracinobacteroides hominis TaxID=2780086 RepID=UPI0018F57B4D|nr:ChaN family lipoprotein [Sandaracinobacteroides hominis]
MLRPTFLLAALALAAAPANAAHCVAAGQWLDTRAMPLRSADALLAAGKADVVLLGERHAVPAVQLWQRDTIAALAAGGRPLVIGIEYLPRSMQPVLDDFNAGKIDIDSFRRQSKWDELWRHDFESYRPILELARAKSIPLKALNIDRAFVRQVSREGYAAAAAAGAAPVGQPAPPPAAYAKSLEQVFRQHAREATPQAVANFIAAQTVWDRAFAEGLAAILAERPGTLAIGLMGSGHVEGGNGAEHQLAAIRKADVWSAIAVPTAAPCDPPAAAADALFGAD